MAFSVNGVLDYRSESGLVPRKEWAEVTVAYSHDTHAFTLYVNGKQALTHSLHPNPANPVAAVKVKSSLSALYHMFSFVMLF